MAAASVQIWALVLGSPVLQLLEKIEEGVKFVRNVFFFFFFLVTEGRYVRGQCSGVKLGEARESPPPPRAPGKSPFCDARESNSSPCVRGRSSPPAAPPRWVVDNPNSFSPNFESCFLS